MKLTSQLQVASKDRNLALVELRRCDLVLVGGFLAVDLIHVIDCLVKNTCRSQTQASLLNKHIYCTSK